MPDTVPVEEKKAASGGKIRRTESAILVLACALVIGIYAGSANSGLLEFAGSNAEHSYYNLLVQGFRAGQLNLKTETPPGLVQLSDPYDPAANDPFRLRGEQPLHDVSYYKGKLYLYFGITPALVLFWPYAALTGHYLLHKNAAVIFFSAGFLAGAGLLLAVWRRYFVEVRFWIIVCCVLALGLANFTPAILARGDVYEVAISCGYALTMLALAAIWLALHQPQRRGRWLAAASLAYGLALGARPSLLFGAVILLAPVIQAWREKQRVWRLLIAMGVPIVLVGLGLMYYNDLRFDNPLEFGQHYQVSSTRQDTTEHFRLRYLWYNFRIAFLTPARWDGHFPYVHDIVTPSLPKGADKSEHPFGVLTNIPLVWMALAVPLAWRSRSAKARSILRRFLVALSLLFGICALTIGLHFIMCLRYELEFTHALLLLSVIGVISLERALAGQLSWRRAARWGWGSLLMFSLAFNLAASIELHAAAHLNCGGLLMLKGRPDEAIAQYQEALKICPEYADALNDMGFALFKKGDLEAAAAQYRKALEIQPRSTNLCYNLGNALASQGKLDDAIAQFRTALEIAPDYADARNNLGAALFRKGNLDAAIAQYRLSLETAPDNVKALNNLGAALYAKGDLDAAIAEYRKAVEIAPDYVEAHYSLGVVLFAKGDLDAAIAQYRKTLEIRPDYAEARSHLGNALLKKGDIGEAIAQFRDALKITPRNPEILRTLAAAYSEQGSFGLATDTARRAEELAVEQKKDALAATLQKEIQLYETKTPVRNGPQ